MVKLHLRSSGDIKHKVVFAQGGEEMSSKGGSSCSQTNASDGLPSHAVNNYSHFTTTYAKGGVMSDNSDTATLDDSNHSFQSRTSVNEGPLKKPIDVRPFLEKLNIDVDRLALVKHLFPSKGHGVPIEPVVINMNELKYKMCGERLVIIDQMIESMYRHGKSPQADASVNRLRNERLKVEEEMRELVMQMNNSKSSSRPNNNNNNSHKQGGVGAGGEGSRSSIRPVNKPNRSSTIVPGSSISSSSNRSSTPFGTDVPVSSASIRPDTSYEDMKTKRPRSGTTTQQEIEVADILVSLMS